MVLGPSLGALPREHDVICWIYPPAEHTVCDLSGSPLSSVADYR